MQALAGGEVFYLALQIGAVLAAQGRDQLLRLAFAMQAVTAGAIAPVGARSAGHVAAPPQRHVDHHLGLLQHLERIEMRLVDLAQLVGQLHARQIQGDGLDILLRQLALGGVGLHGDVDALARLEGPQLPGEIDRIEPGQARIGAIRLALAEGAVTGRAGHHDLVGVFVIVCPFGHIFRHRFFLRHARRQAVRDALVAVDAGLALFHGVAMDARRESGLTLHIHGLEIMAVAALARIGRLHVGPDMAGQPQALFVELFRRIHRANGPVIQLVGGPDLADQLGDPLLRHMAVRADGAHARWIGIMRRLDVVGIHVVAHFVAGGAELQRVGGLHGGVETAPEDDAGDEHDGGKTQLAAVAGKK